MNLPQQSSQVLNLYGRQPTPAVWVAIHLDRPYQETRAQRWLDSAWEHDGPVHHSLIADGASETPNPTFVRRLVERGDFESCGNGTFRPTVRVAS